eukprot:GHVL01016261.1.p1 GENE.GHVL01016261.1~~GHVL01016261.1.p1  ORF type:complete len:125 (+),score=20.60 GHVL01016261.1:979-1353(+)
MGELRSITPEEYQHLEDLLFYLENKPYDINSQNSQSVQSFLEMRKKGPLSKVVSVGAKAYEKTRKVGKAVDKARGGVLDQGGAIAATIFPDECWPKLIFIYYVEPDEDDYGYVPSCVYRSNNAV